MTLSFNHAPSRVHYDDGQRQLILRPAHLSDAPELVAALHESLAELRQFMPWAHFPQTIQVQEKRLKELEADHGSGGDIVFHIFEREDGPYLGCIGLHGSRVINPLGFEIGYWTRTSAAGRGLITLATQCALVLGFECFGSQRIQCGYNEENKASERVNQKVGFSHEARLRYFEPQPTDEMRANGCQMGPSMVMTALFEDDRSRLDWYPAVSAALTVYGPEGSVVWPQKG